MITGRHSLLNDVPVKMADKIVQYQYCAVIKSVIKQPQIVSSIMFLH